MDPHEIPIEDRLDLPGVGRAVVGLDRRPVFGRQRVVVRRDRVVRGALEDEQLSGISTKRADALDGGGTCPDDADPLTLVVDLVLRPLVAEIRLALEALDAHLAEWNPEDRDTVATQRVRQRPRRVVQQPPARSHLGDVAGDDAGEVEPFCERPGACRLRIDECDDFREAMGQRG